MLRSATKTATVSDERGAATDRPVRVFLLDDHEIVRRGLRDLLESSGGIEVVGEAGTADDAHRRIPPTRPDVAILDVRLPDGDGVEVCRDVRAANPELQCLIPDLIAEGLTNRQIAERIHLAEKTVKNYVSNLLATLGMERRTQAAVSAAGLKDRNHRDDH